PPHVPPSTVLGHLAHHTLPAPLLPLRTLAPVQMPVRLHTSRPPQPPAGSARQQANARFGGSTHRQRAAACDCLLYLEETPVSAADRCRRAIPSPTSFDSLPSITSTALGPSAPPGNYPTWPCLSQQIRSNMPRRRWPRDGLIIARYAIRPAR